MTFRGKLASRSKKAGITLESDVIQGLEAYFGLLQRWNRKVSLTSLPVDKLGDEAIDRILIEPLIASKYLPSRSAVVIDVGTGGGSPAIPMKIANPGISMRMVESKTRKAAFLREVIRHLGVEHTMVEGSRFEELLARPELHEAADVVTMRAVKAEKKTMMGLQAFLKPGGLLFLFRTNSTSDSELFTPPLAWQANHPLLPALNSELAIFVKSHGRP
jgi:16S rRNA (guanine527-N7)-methyltransferase